MQQDLKRFVSAVAVVAIVMSLSPAEVASAGERAEEFPTGQWGELVPKGWNPFERFQRDVGRIGEGSAQETAMMQELREILDSAPTRSELDGTKLRLPGYVVPLESGRGGVKQFLLVPYFGACIHTPPPPANQIVHVVLATPKPLRTMEAVWVSGTLRVDRQDSRFGVSGYRLDGVSAEPYRRPGQSEKESDLGF